jgi:predicted GNAT family acetyltransferase
MAALFSPASPQIRHLPDQQRFELEFEGETGELDYRLDGAAMAILHTAVSPAIQGRGMAAALTGAALDHARAAGWKVRPRCSYAHHYFQRHPENADLLG